MEDKTNKRKQTESIKESRIEFTEEISKEILDDLKNLPEGEAGLVVIKGPGIGEKFFLTKSKFEIGRSPDSDILLDDITVSRKHAILEKVKDEYRILDLGSLNGSYINGVRVDSSKLSNGDRIQIGKYVFLFFSSR